MLASAPLNEGIRLWEVTTGKERRRFRGNMVPEDKNMVPEANGSKIAFSPDGKLVASTGHAIGIMLWDVADTVAGKKAGVPLLADEQLRAIWRNLAGNDAPRAYAGICRLIQSPAQSLPFLKDQLRPVPAQEPTKMAKLISDLNSDQSDVREKACQELAKLGDVVEPGLNEFLNGKLSAESRRRAEELLTQSAKAEPTGEALRAIRAVEVLEYIGTPEACQVLQSLRNGAAEARLTREAKASLDRLAKRAATRSDAQGSKRSDKP
jgi:hypothetical protein